MLDGLPISGASPAGHGKREGAGWVLDGQADHDSASMGLDVLTEGFVVFDLPGWKFGIAAAAQTK